MSAVVLNNPFQGGHEISESKIKSYEQGYRELKSEIITDDKETSTKQVASHLSQTQKLK